MGLLLLSRGPPKAAMPARNAAERSGSIAVLSPLNPLSRRSPTRAARRYGLPAAGEVQDTPRPAPAAAAAAEQQKPTITRGSAGSLSDSPGGQEQGESRAGAEGEQYRRHEAANHQQAANAAVGAAPRLLQNGAFDDDSALGTWAGRQRIFSDHLRQQELEQEREEQQHAALRAAAAAATAELAGNTAASRARGESPPMAAPAPAMQPGPAVVGEMSLDQEMNAAWRWAGGRVPWVP